MWIYNYSYNNELYHYGIKGMKWGVRRFQNEDGSLTTEGRRRSDSFIERQQRRAEKKDRKAPERLDMPNNVSSTTKRVIKDYNSINSREFSSKYQVSKSTYAKRVKKYGDPYMNSPLAKYGKKLQAKEKAKAEKKKLNNVSEKIKNSKPVKEVEANYEHGKRYGILGVAGNARGQAIRANNKYIVKGIGVALLNTSVNNFIKNSNASYSVKRGADFVRKAGITALSISAIKDSIQMYANIGASALGAIDKYSSSNDKG